MDVGAIAESRRPRNFGVLCVCGSNTSVAEGALQPKCQLTFESLLHGDCVATKELTWSCGTLLSCDGDVRLAVPTRAWLSTECGWALLLSTHQQFVACGS